MAHNRIPQNLEALLTLAEHDLIGMEGHGEEVGLAHHWPEALRILLRDINGDGAAKAGARARLNQVRTLKVAATALLVTAKQQGRSILSACIGILKPRLGNPWTPAWREAGFTGGGPEISANPLDQLRLMSGYLAAHPDYEIKNLTDRISCTAEACRQAAAAIIAADAGSREGNANVDAAKQALEQATRKLRDLLSGLRAELDHLLDADDPRWYLFGFNRPSDPILADIPDNLTLTIGIPGVLYAHWDPSPRALNYRISVVAEDGTTLSERLVAETESTITDLPPGAKVTVVITALNEAGESRSCDAVEWVVG